MFFEGAALPAEFGFLPMFSERYLLSSAYNEAKVSIDILETKVLSALEQKLVEKAKYQLSSEPLIYHRVVKINGQNYCYVSVLPFIQNGRSLEKVVSFQLNIQGEKTSFKKRSNARGFATNSVLSSGTWYKLAVTQDAVYKMDYAFLKSLGWDLKNVSSSSISLFGNGWARLPFWNQTERPDDLSEIPIKIQDGGDGRIDDGDYILFFARGPHRWTNASGSFRFERNWFTDSAYYFLSYDAPSAQGKRVSTRSSLNSSDQSSNSFDHFEIVEEDKNNLIKSGRNWVGENFDFVPKKTYEFEVLNPVSNELARLRSKFVIRTIQSKSEMQITLRGIVSKRVNDGNGITGVYYEAFGREVSNSIDFNPQENLVVDLEFFKGNADANAWLDYIELTARRFLIMEGNQMSFRDSKLEIGKNANYTLDGISPKVKIWDVTNIWEIREQSFNFSANQASFNVSQDTLKEFIAFYENKFSSPTFVSQIENQNLHGLVSEYPDLIIVCPKFLEGPAKELAQIQKG